MNVKLLFIMSLLSISNATVCLADEIDPLQSAKPKDATFNRLLHLAEEHELDRNMFHLYYDSAYAMAVTSGDSLNYSRALCLKARYVINSGNLAEGIDILNAVTPTVLRNNYESLVQVVYLQYGIAYCYQGSYDLALKYLFQTLRLREESGVEMDMSAAWSAIGLTYHKMKDNTMALQYHKKGLGIIEQQFRKSDAALHYINMGLVYLELKQYDSAFYSYEKAMASCGMTCPDFIKMNLSFAEGKTDLARGLFKKAEGRLIECFEQAELLGDYRFQAESLVYLARTYIATNSPRQATAALERAEKIAEANQLNEILLDVYRQNILVSSGYKDAKMKAFWQQKYIDLSHVLYNERLVGKISALEVEFAESDNVKTMNEQESLLLLQKEEIRQRRIVIILVIIAALIFAAIVFLLVKSNAKKRKLNEMLDQVVHERTRDLEVSYHQSLAEMEALDLTFRQTLGSVKSGMATLKGICYLGQKESDDPKDQKSFKELYNLTEQIERASNDAMKSLGLESGKVNLEISINVKTERDRLTQIDLNE